MFMKRTITLLISLIIISTLVACSELNNLSLQPTTGEPSTTITTPS